MVDLIFLKHFLFLHFLDSNNLRSFSFPAYSNFTKSTATNNRKRFIITWAQLLSSWEKCRWKIGQFEESKMNLGELHNLKNSQITQTNIVTFFCWTRIASVIHHARSFSCQLDSYSSTPSSSAVASNSPWIPSLPTKPSRIYLAKFIFFTIKFPETWLILPGNHSLLSHSSSLVLSLSFSKLIIIKISILRSMYDLQASTRSFVAAEI